MESLAALVLIVLSAAPQPAAPAMDPGHANQAQNAPAPVARRLTPEQKAWFAHAVDRILTGN